MKATNWHKRRATFCDVKSHTRSSKQDGERAVTVTLVKDDSALDNQEWLDVVMTPDEAEALGRSLLDFAETARAKAKVS